MKIGMIGLGGMGSGIAGALLDRGHTVIGFDTDADRRSAFAAAGQVAESAGDVADKAALVFSCLPSGKACLTVADEVARGTSVQTYVELSTIGRSAIASIAQVMERAGIGFVDSPVSGGPPVAREGKLTAAVAGSTEAVEAVRPALEAFTVRVFVVGQQPGQAQICKLVNNILSIAAFVTTCEAVTVGVKAGADAAQMIDFINASTGRNSATTDKFPKAILPRTFDFGGPFSIGEKDVELYLALAREMQMPASVGSVVAELFHRAAGTLGSTSDYSNLIRMFEEWAGVEVRGG